MSDLIDREKLIADLNKFAPEHYTALVNNIITQQPSASRPTGEWNIEQDNGADMYVCSVCGCRMIARDFDRACGTNALNFCGYCRGRYERRRR